MSGFGMFEANVTSDAEEKRHVREAANKLAAATYDVRERFGQFLFGSKDLTEYNDRLALSKNDILKTIEPHVFPRTGTVRRVLKPLEDEFKSRRGNIRTARPKSEGYEGVPVSPSGGREPGWGGAESDKWNSPANMSPASLSNRSQFTPNSSPTPAAAAANGSPNDPQAFKDGGPGNNTPSIGGDPIGPGKYEIQSGDTYSDLAQRAGWGDDYKGFAQSTGYQADNPDMIYAGDSIDVKAKPGASSTSTTTTPDASTPEPGGSAPTSGVPGVPDAPAPLAAESSNLLPTGGSLPPGESNTQTGLTNPIMPSASRRAASRRRYAEFEGELEPKGDFKGYLSDVDEGDEGRTTNNFGGTFPGGTDHNGDPANTDFVKDSTRRFALWCKANRRLASLDSLESYAPSDREYVAIAATLQRVAASGVPGSTPTGPEWNSKGKPKLNKPTKPAKIDMPELPGIGAPMGSLPGNKSAAAGDHWTTNRPSSGPRPSSQEYPISIPGHGKHSLENNWDGMGEDPYSYGDEKEITLLPRQQVKKSIPKHRAEAGKHDNPYEPGPLSNFHEHTRVADPAELVQGDPQYMADRPMMKRIEDGPGKHREPQHRPMSHQYPNTLNSLYEGGTPTDEDKIEFFRDRSGRRRRTAAPDYLQKADEALTNLLNQKAEEFQGQIAPLQQALQTVQQAEQAAAAANPMNVMPPAGTVNVLPGGDPSGGAGGAEGGLDPNALAAMMGGGDPNAGGGDPMGGADPSVGGGAPPGLDPNAMGGAPPAAQDQGLPPMMARRFARLHQAKNCECWDGYKRVPGTKPCAKGSCEKCDTHKESRRRQAKNVDQMWEEFAANATQRGGEPDVDAFAQKYKVGPIALKRIRQKISADNRKRGGQGKGRRASAHQAGRHSAPPTRWVGMGEEEYQSYINQDPKYSGGRHETFSVPQVEQQDNAQLRLPFKRYESQRAASRRQAWSGWGGASPSMQRVAGWDFDHRLNGYITTAADKFSCDCGDEFSTPSGYRKCGSCGRAWNSYVIGTDGHGKEASLEKVICREIPVRKDVIVASRRKADPNGQYDPEWNAPKWRFSGEPGDYGYSDEKQQQAWESALQEHGYEHKPMSRYGPSHSSWVHHENEQRIPAYPWDGWSPGQPFVSPKPNARTPQTFGEPWMNYTMFKEADKHTLRRIDLRDMMDQEPEEDKPDIEHFASRRTAANYEDWARERGYKPGGPHSENERMHWHYDTGTGSPEDWEGVPKEWGDFNNWKPKKKATRRRAAGDWNRNPDKNWPLDDGDWGGLKKKKKNKDFDGPDDPMFGFNSLGIDGPGPKGPSPRYYAARSYVAQCRRAGRRPTPEGLRRFMGSQQRNAKSKTSAQPKNKPGLIDHYLNDTGPNFPGKTVVDFTDPQWQTKTNWDGTRYDADGSPVFPFVPLSDRVKGKPYFISPEHAHPKGWYGSSDYIEHGQTCPTCSIGERHAPYTRRRRAEHFDITEEGGTPKGKGKPSKKTTMSTPDAQWYRRNRGGRYT